MADQAAITELELYIANTSALQGQIGSICKNLINKLAAGKYNHSKAADAWAYVAEAGAKMYAKEFGSTWYVLFPPDVRRKVSKDLADEWLDEAKLGNYNHLLAKKYR